MRSFKRFLALLATIPDPRRGQGKMYTLPYLLQFSILAVVAGANSYRGICTFIQVHRGKLNRAFALGWRRAPAYTSIRYILQGLKAADVEKVFRAHAALLDDGGPRRRCLALDGKALRGSFDAFNDQRGKQVLSVFATAPALAQVEIAGAGRDRREIQRNPRRPEAAGGTRRCRPHRHARRAALSKKTFAAAAKAKVHLIVQLKENQQALHRRVDAVCRRTAPRSAAHTLDAKRRNRHEVRLIGVFDAAAAVAGTEWQPFVAAIIKIERIVNTFQPATGLWRRSHEDAFYLSNRPISAAVAAKLIRGHWGSENRLHYVRDVTFGEDASRIRINPGIFARSRSFAYNILRINQVGSIAQTRYAAALAGINALLALNYFNQR